MWRLDGRLAKTSRSNEQPRRQSLKDLLAFVGLRDLLIFLKALAKEYLKELLLSDEVRSKLAALGYPTLFDLVARAKAAPRAFAEYLGELDGVESAIIQEMESH